MSHRLKSESYCMSGARKDRAERDSDILSRVRPLNLIRIMPAEEECASRPPAIRVAFFVGCPVTRFQVSGVSLWPRGPSVGLETCSRESAPEKFQVSV